MKHTLTFLLALAFPLAAFARGGWQDPPGGWLYVYEADPGEDACMPGFWQRGCLDGEWMRGASSDQWDCSKPGEGAPGGIEVLTLPGEGEDGGDASVLSIEDTGDPRAQGFSDPSNRKLYLVRDTSAELTLEEGITLCARFRLNPEPKDVQIPAGQPGNGMTLHDQVKGMLGYTELNVGAVTMAIDDNQNLLVLDNSNIVDIGGDGTEWITVWLTAQYLPDTGETIVALFLNGSEDPEPGFEESSYFLNTSSFETGGNPTTSYINIAAGSTGRDCAWQLDYFCIASGYNLPVAEVTSCPGALTCTVDGKDVKLAWDNRGVTVSSFKIERGGTVLEGSLAGSNTSFTDSNVPPAEYQYTVTPVVEGRECSPLQCSVNMCVSGLTCSALGDNVTLKWKNGAAYSGIVIERDGATVATIDGTLETWSETVTEPGDYTYAVLPSEGTCDPATCSVTVLPSVPEETADFAPPPDGWGYVYDPEPDSPPEEMLQYEPDPALVGCLDGTWRRHDGSDRWDGSAPGEVDTTTDIQPDGVLDGAAPGGVGLDVVPGGAPGGAGDAGVLSFEDTGDPSSGNYTWEGVPMQWADAIDPAVPKSGSNRKIYLGRNLNDLCEDEIAPESLLDTGVTLNVRLRLTPADAVKDFEGAGLTAPDGMGPQSNAKGLITLYWLPEFPTAEDPVRKLPIYLYADTGGNYWLDVGMGNEQDVIRAYLGSTPEEGTRFVNVWITVERVDNPDRGPLVHHVSVYLNGSPDLYMEKDVVLDPGDAENESGWGNVIVMGTMSTPEVVAYQLDFLRIAAGVHQPQSAGVQELFVRGDANDDGQRNIADAVSILGYLFGGEEPPACEDASDTNDDGAVNIADAIKLLGHLFGGEGPLPAPFPDCGTDPTPDDLPPCTYTHCP